MRRFTQLLFAALACFCLHQHAIAADPGRGLIPQLQERFGLSEAQVRGSLGALLVFVRERLPKTQFDELSKSIPNADYIMREVRMRGIVTMPLDDIEEYQESLAKLGIGHRLPRSLRRPSLSISAPPDSRWNRACSRAC